jgi:hypothetical protein
MRLHYTFWLCRFIYLIDFSDVDYRLETGGQGSKTFGRDLGLGPNVEERLHGLHVIRNLRNHQSATGWLI